MELLKETTKSKHCINDKYIKIRSNLHKEIINTILEDSPTENPESILMGGGSASGKSFMSTLFLNGAREEGQPFTHIDCDEIKKFLPEYKEMVESENEELMENAAAYVHDESSDIADALLKICIERKLHFLYDGTMKNTKKYEKIITKLKKASYIIRGVIVDVPLDVAFERAEIRFKADGRKVPEEDIIASHESVAMTFSMISKYFDTYVMFDNTNDPVPFVIKDSKDSPAKVINQIRLDEFYDKIHLKSAISE